MLRKAGLIVGLALGGTAAVAETNEPESREERCPEGLTAERPKWSVGDRWQWKSGVVQVVEVTSNRVVTHDSSAPGRTTTRDLEFTIVTEVEADGRPRGFKGKRLTAFPMRVGSEWKDQRHAPRNSDGVMQAYYYEFEVIDCIEVSVEAGTFLAFKIEEFQYTDDWPGTTRQHYWAPKVRSFVIKERAGGRDRLMSFSIE